MAIGVLSGISKDKGRIEIVFEVYYTAESIGTTYNIRGLNVSRNENGSVNVAAGRMSLTNHNRRSSGLKVLTFDNMQREGAGRWATHEIIGQDQKPVLEFIGPDLETVTFSVLLLTVFGVDPESELQKLRQIRDEGIVCEFLIGSSAAKRQTWALTKLSEAHRTYDNAGRLLAASVNITLMEYVE